MTSTSAPSGAASSLCLSSATILRCASLTRMQNILVVIPTALEVIFSTSLLFIFWKSGNRRHLLLSAEGWIYITLTLLDMLSHLLPAARESLDIFTAFDVAIGVSSFLPLFFYTFFLYLFAASDLLNTSIPSSSSPSLDPTNNSFTNLTEVDPHLSIRNNGSDNRYYAKNTASNTASTTITLPTRLAKITSLLLLIFVPAIVSVNEVASFAGVDRLTLPTTPPQILIGFTSPHLYTLNTFFSSLTLALVTLFQALVFLVLFTRLIVGVVRKRRYERQALDKGSLLRGTPYLALALKLGAIETVIGFAGGGFGVIVIRRGMRMLSRALLCIGLSKGIDEIEDFQSVRQELVTATTSNFPSNNRNFIRRASRTLLNLISNPRTSTFQQLSPTARDFYALPKGHLFLHSPDALQGRSVDSALNNYPINSNIQPQPRLRSSQIPPEMAQFTSVREDMSRLRKNQRVTVQNKDGRSGAPVLEMRFSDLELPTPSLLVGGVREKGDSQREIGMRESHGSSAFGSGYGHGYLQQQSLYGFRSKFSTDTPIRDSTTSTPSSFASAEIVVAPQRTLSQRSARARMYQSESLNWSGVISSQVRVQQEDDMTSPTSDYDEYTSRAAYPYPSTSQATVTALPSFVQYPTHQTLSPLALSSASATQSQFPVSPSSFIQSPNRQSFSVYSPTAPSPSLVQAQTPSSRRQERSRSAYKSVTPSVPETLRAVRELAMKFPGPPITYNGRPLMGGIGQERYEDWARESKEYSRVGNEGEVDLSGSDMLDTPTPSAFSTRFSGVSSVGRGNESSGFIPYALGSPRELMFDRGNRGALGVDKRISRDSPRIVISHEGQIPVPLNRQRQQGNTVGLALNSSFLSTVSSAKSYNARPIDPFDSEIEDNESAKFPIAQRIQMVPSRNPVTTMTSDNSTPRPAAASVIRPKLTFNNPSKNLYTNSPKHNVSVPNSPENDTPVSTVSGYTPSVASNVSSTPDTADVFSELAVRTGGSRDLKGPTSENGNLEPDGKGGNARSRASGSMGKWNAEEIALPVKPARAVMASETVPPATRTTSANNSSLPSGSRGHRLTSTVVLITPEGPIEDDAKGREAISSPPAATLTDERERRQQSIDAAAHALSNSIPWLKTPEVEDDERRLQQAISSTNLASRRPKISRLKSMGKAPQRSTPAPVRHTAMGAAMRGSLHIEPIMIPPAAIVGTTEAIQGSVGSVSSVLRDSTVFGADELHLITGREREPKRSLVKKEGNYF